MKKILFLGLAALICGCHEDITDGNGIQGVDPVILTADIYQQYVTRASDGGFAGDDQIGVFVVNYENGEPQPLKANGNYADNVRFTYSANDGKWTGSYQLYWKDKNTHADAYGYYPFDADLSSVEAYPFTIQTNQSATVQDKTITGYEASDFLWAKAEYVAAGTPIYLKHHHMMAGVEVNLVDGIGFGQGEWTGLEKSVLVQNTVTATTINIGNGEVTLSGSDVNTIKPQQRNSTWRAVVAPQAVSADKTLLSITVDGISYDFQRSEEMIYYPGKLHKFTIAVNKQLPKGDYEFTLISEAITPWENDPESHNGAAREYITVHVDEGRFIGDVIDSLGLDPSKIVNLKLTGCLDGRGQFDYIRENMTSLEALNLKELRTKRMDQKKEFWEEYDEAWPGDDCITAGAFENMSTLRYFVWPDSLKGIGQQAFPGSGLCGSLILPEGLKFIGGEAFASYNNGGNYGLSGELYIPSTVEYIGDGAFGRNDKFYFTNELILPAKMKYLGADAFSGCPYMTGTVRVPDGITEFCINTFPDQIGGPLIIPQGVKKINGAGRSFRKYISLMLPEGLEEIEQEAFWGCEKMQGTLILPSTLKKIGWASFEGTGFSHLKLPEGLEIIEDFAFGSCINFLDTLVIPSSVTQIRTGAFANCRQLTAVILPAGLQGIMGDAFAGCSSLDYIECLGSEPPAIEENTFSGVEKDNFTVVVPEGAVEAYKNAPGWCEFKRISAYRNFVCRPMRAKLLNKSNVRDVVINANDSWEVSDCPSWIHVSPSSGNKKTELKVTIDAMPHNQGDREGVVTFLLGRNDEDGHPITCTYNVKQFDYEYEEDAVLQLQKATKGRQGGIDILFVGDGYDAEDIATGTYRQQMEQEMEYFFAVEPYKTYREYFNVSIAMAMSYESGALDSPDKWRNTKFNIIFGASSSGRLLVDFDEIGRYVLQDVTQCPITTQNIGRSLIICVPNSDAYEGLTAMYGDGSAIAVCPHSTLDYPNDARGLIQHEAGGHGWGKLDDEYIYHRAFIQMCPCACCGHVEDVEAMHAMGWGRNVSLTGKYKDVEWRHLIFDERYGNLVDIFDGAHMHSDGIFRSEPHSCMNNNVPYFSTWSRQLIVERIKDAAGETFDFENFVSNDSREWGDKFLTRSVLETPWQSAKAMHSEHHGPVIKKGSPMDYIKKGGRRR